MKRFLILAVAVVGACNADRTSTPLVVFATGQEGNSISKLLADFSDDTGVRVTIDWAVSADNANKLIEKSGKPADVLITDNVADIWRAADRGALRPIRSTALASLHPAMKDPDGHWAAIEMRQQVIVHRNSARPSTTRLDDLGKPEFQGKLCLSSSELPDNRALIAYLIEERGVREAELLVRHWVRNLAQPPFESQQAMLEAMLAGICDYGIGDLQVDHDGLLPFVEPPFFAYVTAAGVGRHAPQPDKAQMLIDWLLKNSAVRVAGDGRWALAEIAGWRDEEAVLLAERAGYR